MSTSSETRAAIASCAMAGRNAITAMMMGTILLELRRPMPNAPRSV